VARSGFTGRRICETGDKVVRAPYDNASVRRNVSPSVVANADVIGAARCVRKDSDAHSDVSIRGYDVDVMQRSFLELINARRLSEERAVGRVGGVDGHVAKRSRAFAQAFLIGQHLSLCLFLLPFFFFTRQAWTSRAARASLFLL
jgi:hypothetical protein